MKIKIALEPWLDSDNTGAPEVEFSLVRDHVVVRTQNPDRELTFKLDEWERMTAALKGSK